MDLDGKSVANNDMWEWEEDDYYITEDPKNVSHCLWDEVNQTEGSLMYMLDEQTPIKDCSGFDCQITNVGDDSNKLLEEYGDSSQQKRRRMLHFHPQSNETAISNEQSSSVFLKSMEIDGAQIDDEPSSSINVEWNSQWTVGISDGSCALNSEAWDQPSEGWLDNCLNEGIVQCNTDETTTPINCDEASNQQVHISEVYKLSAGMETNSVEEVHVSPPPKAFKIRKSITRTSTNLTTSVAYPFALIKPCGVEGDLTLKDINQRIHTPAPSRSNQMQDENSSLSYPTSAFSGKPVIVKTKIRTEGGKGSITIMRTKG